LIQKGAAKDAKMVAPQSSPVVRDGPVSADEFKEQAAQQVAPLTRSDVAFPVNLDAEYELRQRSVSRQSAAIKLTLRYGEATRNLFVVVGEVANLSRLMTGVSGGNHHFYVSMTLMPFQTKRRTKEFVGDPDHQVYEETLDFPIENEVLMKTAYLEVKIKTKSGVFAKDAVASVIVSLEPVIGMNSRTEWYDLVDADPSK
jgi:C2 domain